MTTDLSKKLIRTISSICILGTLTAAAAFAAGDPSISIDKELFSQAAISPAKLDEIYASQPAADPVCPVPDRADRCRCTGGFRRRCLCLHR